MGFLSKRSMLVSLLALSLAACATPIQQTPIPATNTIKLPCSGNVPQQHVATTITFTGSPCELEDVDFIPDPHGNSQHFKKTKPATSADPTVVFTYGLTTPVPGDGAYFYYSTKSTKSPNPDGGGGGIIK
jgi:hypothetical protein